MYQVFVKSPAGLRETFFIFSYEKNFSHRAYRIKLLHGSENQ